MKALTAALAACVVSACASVPVDLATAPHVPADRIFNQEMLQVQSGHVPVLVSYDNSRDIGSMSFMLYVDGERLALMKEGEQVRFFVSPGRHVLTTMLGEKKNNVMTSAIPDYFQVGSSYEYRIMQGLEGGIKLTPG